MPWSEFLTQTDRKRRFSLNLFKNSSLKMSKNSRGARQGQNDNGMDSLQALMGSMSFGTRLNNNRSNNTSVIRLSKDGLLALKERFAIYCNNYDYCSTPLCTLETFFAQMNRDKMDLDFVLRPNTNEIFREIEIIIKEKKKLSWCSFIAELQNSGINMPPLDSSSSSRPKLTTASLMKEISPLLTTTTATTTTTTSTNRRQREPSKSTSKGESVDKSSNVVIDLLDDSDDEKEQKSVIGLRRLSMSEVKKELQGKALSSLYSPPKSNTTTTSSSSSSSSSTSSSNVFDCNGGSVLPETPYTWTHPCKGSNTSKLAPSMTTQTSPTTTAKRDVKSLIAQRFKSIPTEEKEWIFSLLSHRSPPGYNKSTCITSNSKYIALPLEKLWCLRFGEWLNDEAVNYTMLMLQQRDEELCTIDPTRRPSHFYSSYFVDRLHGSGSGYCYSNIRRWSKKFKTFDQDKIFFPVNRGNTHWTMAAIYIEKREIIYYDSMGSAGRDITESLLRYLDDESKDKRGYPLEDKNSWSLKKGKSPIQTNGYDCGVFATMNIDFLSDDLPLQYNQGDIALFRNKIAANIVRGTMDYDV